MAADCKSAGLAPTEVRTLPSPPSNLISLAGVAQLVDRQPSKLGVAGSNPVARSITLRAVGAQEGFDDPASAT